MSIETELLILKKLPLFHCIIDEQLRLVVFGSERQRLREGRTLYRENQPADCAYVVLSGQIDLMRTRKKTQELVRSVMPGSMIGEMALLAKTKRPVSAIAARESEVLRISRNIFHRILDEYPETGRRIYAYLNDEFRTMIEQMESVVEKLHGESAS